MDKQLPAPRPEAENALISIGSALQQTNYRDPEIVGGALQLIHCMKNYFTDLEFFEEKDFLLINRTLVILTELVINSDANGDWVDLLDKFFKLRLSAQIGEKGRKVKGLLLCVQEKSGSWYVQDKMVKYLNLTWSRVSNYGPTTTSNFTRLQANHLYRHVNFSCGGSVCAIHLPCSEQNLNIMNKFALKPVAMFRDPRQTLLSYAHTMERRYKSDDVKFGGDAYLPGYYFEIPFADRLSWLFSNYFPQQLEWIRGWYIAYKKEMIDQGCLMLTFEDMKRDEEEFFQKIWEFYGLKKSLFPDETEEQRHADMLENVHYRAGRTDEWREVFNSDHLAMIDRIITPEDTAMFEFFKWKM